MNKVVLIGRLTRDPEIRYSAGDQSQAVARYTLAVDRRMRRDNNDPNAQTADFISCVVFGRGAQFAEQYFYKGIKIAVTGRIQTGKYTKQDGQTVYTTDVVVEDQEFAESKNANGGGTQDQGYSAPAPAVAGYGYSQPAPAPAQAGYGYSQPAPAGYGYAQPAPNIPQGEEGFINIPEGIEDELPFR